jgi:hypothetical protein
MTGEHPWIGMNLLHWDRSQVRLTICQGYDHRRPGLSLREHHSIPALFSSSYIFLDVWFYHFFITTDTLLVSTNHFSINIMILLLSLNSSMSNLHLFDGQKREIKRCLKGIAIWFEKKTTVSLINDSPITNKGSHMFPARLIVSCFKKEKEMFSLKKEDDCSPKDLGRAMSWRQRIQCLLF